MLEVSLPTQIVVMKQAVTGLEDMTTLNKQWVRSSNKRQD
jgi:hypothetical protein